MPALPSRLIYALGFAPCFAVLALLGWTAYVYVHYFVGILKLHHVFPFTCAHIRTAAQSRSGKGISKDNPSFSLAKR